jgi:hypothetical protein
MSLAASAPDPEPPSDPAVLRAERRLRVLQELTEIGMRLARALERRVLAEDEAATEEAAEPAAGAAAGRDPAVAFAQLSRAVRLTLALEAKTDEALRALMAGVEQAREQERVGAAERARRAAAHQRTDRLEQIRDLVLEAAVRDLRDEDHIERLDSELEERLDEDEAFWIDPERPLRDIVERVCRYFGLAPDWSRWDGEGWVEDDPPPWPWAAAPDARPTEPPPPSPNPAPTLAGAQSLE